MGLKYIQAMNRIIKIIIKIYSILLFHYNWWTSIYILYMRLTNSLFTYLSQKFIFSSKLKDVWSPNYNFLFLRTNFRIILISTSSMINFKYLLLCWIVFLLYFIHFSICIFSFKKLIVYDTIKIILKLHQLLSRVLEKWLL